jgi:predicted membrane-bound spermidine synthase
MGLLQRLSVFLGHPIYSLSIVLFSLILTTGIGSLVSDRLPLDTRARFVLWGLATACYLSVLPMCLPAVLHAAESAPLAMRAALSVAVIAPAGVLMGFGFPTGMRFINAVNPTPTLGSGASTAPPACLLRPSR